MQQLLLRDAMLTASSLDMLFFANDRWITNSTFVSLLSSIFKVWIWIYDFRTYDARDFCGTCQRVCSARQSEAELFPIDD